MTEEKKEENSIDVNFDSISDINLKNNSFYSFIDPVEYKSHAVNNTNNLNHDTTKYKYDYKVNMESVRMLPLYLEKVTQNINSIDYLVTKQKSISNSRATSKERTTNNTSGSNIMSEHFDIASIQNIVKKSVEGVNDILNNKKLSISSGITGSGSILNPLYQNVNNQTTATTTEISPTNNEKLATNISNISTRESNNNFPTMNVNNQATQNFAIIEERDEDLFSRNSNIINEATHKKKKLQSNLNKASFVGGMKKVSFTNPANNSSFNTTPKKIVTDTNKTKVNFKKPNPSNTASKHTSYNNPLLTSINKKLTSMNTASNNTSKKQKINSPLSKKATTPDSSTFLAKKKQLILTSTELPSHHKKTPSLTYGTENLMYINKSKRSFLTPGLSERKQKDRMPDFKTSTGDLRNIVSFNTKKPLKLQATKKSLSQSHNSKNICTCKCHLIGKKPSTFNNTKSNKNTISTINQTSQNNFKLNVINKIHDVNEIDTKNLVELVYIYNEISTINQNNLISQDKKQNYHKNNQSDLSRILKNFLDTNCDDAEIVFNTNIDNSSNSNSLSNLSFERKRSELNKRRDLKKNNKIIIIQRKWREHRIKNIISKMITLGLISNKVDDFSLVNCNRNEIIKICKLHLYSSMLKISEKFKYILSLINEANFMWNEFGKDISKIFFNM